MLKVPQRFQRALTVLMAKEGEAPSSPSPPVAAPCPPVFSWFQTAGQTIHDRGLFVGCPLELFELTARDPLCVALMEGLKPSSSVLEVGCGCLRVGYWFIQYLNAGHYCGIEPASTMLEAGREVILGPLDAEKAPRFRTDDQFPFAEFGTTFDFVIAFSIWSHASKNQIETMLDAFKATANPGAKFLASWMALRPTLTDYQGNDWVGRSHESSVPGYIGHSREWIMEAGTARGLEVKFFDGFVTIHQSWVIVTRP